MTTQDKTRQINKTQYKTRQDSIGQGRTGQDKNTTVIFDLKKTNARKIKALRPRPRNK